jgi:pilus assembly protein Flp/PilA
MTMRRTWLPGRVEHEGIRGGAVSRLIADDLGVTAIEYAVIAGLIALAIVTAITQIGTEITVPFSTIASNL